MNDQWPFVCAAAVIALAGICQVMMRRIPNMLTFLCFCGAFLACGETPAPLRATGLALLCAFTSFVLMLPTMIGNAWAGSVGAGSVKMQVTFSAWLGVGMSFRTANGMSLTVLCCSLAYFSLLMCVHHLGQRGSLTY